MSVRTITTVAMLSLTTLASPRQEVAQMNEHTSASFGRTNSAACAHAC